MLCYLAILPIPPPFSPAAFQTISCLAFLALSMNHIPDFKTQLPFKPGLCPALFPDYAESTGMAREHKKKQMYAQLSIIQSNRKRTITWIQ